MSPVLRFIGTAWTFFWRQTALQRTTFALVFLPMLAMGYLDLSLDAERAEQTAVIIVLYLACVVLLTWGIACTLTVGKRLLQAKAGRLRTSFKAVRGHAKGMIVPLLLTDILRGCIAIFWSLPAIAFGVFAMTTLQITYLNANSLAEKGAYWYLAGLCALLALPAGYLALTVLAPQAVIYEKLSPREALARSRALTSPRLLHTFAMIIIVGFFWLPGLASDALMASYVHPDVALFASPVVAALFDTIALTVWLLSLTQFYKALGGRAKASAEDNDE